MVWDPGGLTILGIDVLKSSEEHYRLTLNKAEKVLQTWYCGELTLFGKVLIVNTLVIPLFIYGLQVLDSPSAIINEQFKKIVENFIWSNKRPKIKTGMLSKPVNKGGVKLVNLLKKDMLLKITWIFRTDPHTESQIEQFIPNNLGTLFWDCALSPGDITKICDNIDCPKFWKEIVILWFTYKWEKEIAILQMN